MVCLYHGGGSPPAPPSSYPGAVSGAQPVAGIALDPVEERLWLADSDGYLASYALLPQPAPYCSVRACWPTTYDDAAWGITSMSRSLLRPVPCAR